MLVWITNDSLEDAGKIAKALQESVAVKNGSGFGAILTFVNVKGENSDEFAKKLADFSTENKLEKISVSYLGPEDRGVKIYKINTEADVENTILVYTKKRVTAKFVNLKPEKEELAKLIAAINDIAP